MTQKFWAGLEVLLNSGVSLTQALELMAEKNPDKKVRKLAKEGLKSVRAGKYMVDALRKDLDLASYGLLKAGEVSNKLPFAIAKVMKLNEVKRKVIASLLGSLAYPVSLLFMVSGLSFFMGQKVLPQMLSNFDPVAIRKLSVTPIFLTLSNPVLLISIIVFIISFSLAIFFIARTYTGSLRAKIDNYFPFNYYRWWMGVVLLYVLYAMLNAGVLMQDALKEIGQLNSYYRLITRKTIRLMEERGLNFGEALYATGFYLPDRELVALLIILFQTSDFSKLESLTDALLMKAEDKVKAFGKVLNTVGMILVGLFLLLYVFSLSELVRTIMEQTSKVGF